MKGLSPKGTVPKPKHPGLSRQGTVPLRNTQGGYLLVTIIVTLFLVATVAMLLNRDSAISANTSNAELDRARAEYVAQAAMQHALWRTQNNACMGNVTIPATAIGPDTYSALITGAASGTSYSLSADQDAWIRSDQPTTNNGGDSNLHIKDSQVEQPLYRFDLSSLPTGAQIHYAAVSFYVSGEHPEGPVTVHRITAGWNEGDVTWDSISGSVDSSVVATISAQPDMDVRVQVNLTGQVQAWVNGEPNNGILLASTAPGIHAQYVSREGAAGEHPRLDVVVGSGPATPVAIQATGTLATGVTRTLSQSNAPAYQPPIIHTLSPNATDSTDAEIWDQSPNNNYGDSAETWVSSASNDKTRSLLRFNMDAIPVGARILEAEIFLYRQSGSGADQPVSAHRITNLWSEASVTWNERESGTAWDTAGGDFESQAIVTTPVGPTNQRYEWDITPLAQGWVDGSYDNNGVALIAGVDGMAGERFYTSDHTDPAERPGLTITYACECGSACMAPNGSGNVLMPVTSTSNPSPGELSRIALLESWGYVVDTTWQKNSQSNFNSAIAANDVVYVPATVDQNEIATKLTDAPVGVISELGALNDELGIASGNAAPVGTSINISDNSHYITIPFVAGDLPVYSAAMEGATIAGAPAPGLQILGEWGGTGGLVVLNPGDALGGGASGQNAAGRRVLLPIGGTNMDLAYLNGNGRLIVQRALAWGMNADAGSSGNLLLVVGNAAGPSSGDLDRKVLMESWGYAVTFIDDGDSQASFDAALAINDVAYVTEGSNPGAIGSKLTGTTAGIVNEEKMLLVELGFSGEVDSNGRSDIVILDNTHSITSGLALGTTTITTSNQPFTFTNNGSVPEAQVIAETNQVASFFEPSLLTLETNAELWGGGFAAGRRVSLPWGDSGFDINALNADGLMIMQRAIEWAAGEGPNLGPIAHWKFDDGVGTTAIDSEGGHDGTLTNGPVWVAGQLGDALNFDASDDFVDLTSDTELDDVFEGGATVMAWIEPAGWGENGYGRVFDKSSSASSTGDGWVIRMNTDNGGIINFGQGFSGGRGWWKIPNGSITLNTWQHIAVAYDASSTANDPVIYLDGSPVAVTRIDSPSGSVRSDASINLRLGNYAGGTAHTFDGKIDDARIYDRMLGAAEIDELYSEGAGGLIAHWKLDDGTGTTALDSEGGHHGTLTNGPVWVAGQLGDALDFDGSNDLVSVPHHATFTQVPMTVSAWFKLDTLPTTRSEHGTIIDKRHTVDPYASWTLYVNEALGNKIRFQIRDSSETGYWLDSAASAVTNTWYHVVGTIDASHNAKLYVNGALEADDDNIGSLFSSNDEIRIGAGWSGGNRLDGVVDDVRFYDQALSAAEISGLYTAGTGGGGGGGGGASYVELFQTWSATSASTWQSVDLSSYGVPANAVVEVSIENSTDNQEREVGVRAVGSGVGRTFDLHEAEQGGMDAIVLHAQADGSSRIEHFTDNTGAITFRLLGYWTGAAYVEHQGFFTAAASGSWQTHSLASYGVSPNQVVEFVAQNTSSGSERQAGGRKIGSGLARLVDLHESESGGKDYYSVFVETDPAASVQIYAENNGDIEFKIPGAWSTPPGTYNEAFVNLGSATSDSSWQTVDLSAHGVPGNAVVQIAMANRSTAAENRQGVRAVGSSADRWIDLHEAESGGEDLVTMHVNADGSSQIQWYHEDVSDPHTFYLMGWWIVN